MVCACVFPAPSIAVHRSITKWHFFDLKNKQQPKQASTEIFRVYEMEFGVWKTGDKELIFHWEIFNQALNVITHKNKRNDIYL